LFYRVQKTFHQQRKKFSRAAKYSATQPNQSGDRRGSFRNCFLIGSQD